MPDSSAATPRERAIQELIAGWLDAEAQGRAPQAEVWLAEHPDFALELRAFLEDHQRLARIGQPLREAAVPEIVVDAPASHMEATLVQPRGLRAGGVIAGRYKLLEPIGEGGMGTVWVADQTEPVRRRVALKVIKPGMDSREVLSRFEAERQALAMMDHPHIARVLDGGMTDDGRPYFVMEYVKGVPITQYCDDARLTVQARLQLFMQVCQAVQHAHQKGIIHRDLKPSNILVCLYDGQPVPKVIDFGLAKAVSQSLTEHTLYTAHGLMVGTPLYMSPEQAEFNNLDVDTRTDVYSLGVILYELLTGATPLEKRQFKNAAFQEILRLIKETDPPKPSTRWSRATPVQKGPAAPEESSLASVAAQRSVEPMQLSRILRGDLDWIVMKALDKERSRRYETANGFARDIERYLHLEPVEACPPSTGYRLQKFTRKHRAAIATASAFAVLLLVGIAISTWQAVRATLAERDALQQSDNAMKARDDATKARDEEKQARLAAEQAGQVARDARAKEEIARKGAEADRDAKQRALDRAEGLRLSAEASAAKHTDPGLSLLLAIEGARRVPNHLTYGVLYDSLSTCRERRVLSRPMSDVQFARFAGGGRWILAAGKLTDINGQSLDGACLFDSQTGKQSAIWKGYNCSLGDIDLASDGKRVAAVIQGSCFFQPEGANSTRYVFTDRVAYVWDAETGKDLVHLRRHNDRVVSVRFSPDGKKLITASWDRTARIWDAATGAELHVLKGHECSLGLAMFSPDGARAVTLSSQQNSESQYPQSVAASGDEQPAIEVDPGIQNLSGVTDDGSASTANLGFLGEGSVGRIWNVETGQEVAALSKKRPAFLTFGTVWHPTSASFHPEGNSIALTFSENAAAVWDLAAGGEEKTLLTGHEGPVLAIVYRPDGRQIATGSADRTARLWDASTGKEVLRMRGHQDAVNSVRFSADGRKLLTTSTDRTARVWDAIKGDELAVLQGHTAAVRAADLHPAGSQIVTGGDSTVRLWDLSPPADLSIVLKGHLGPLTSLAFSPDSQRLLTSARGTPPAEDETPRLWDVASGQEVLVLGKNKLLGDIRSAQFISGGLQVLTASAIAEGTLGSKVVNKAAVHVWDSRSGADLVSLDKHKTGASRAVGSRDGKLIATVSDGTSRIRGRGIISTDQSSGGSSGAGLVRTWDAVDGHLLATLPTQIADDGRPQFSPDGRRLLVIAREGRVRVHDSRTGKELFSLNSPDSTLSAVYCPDGEFIATTTQTDSVRLWNAADGTPLDAIQKLPGPAQLVEMSEDGRRIVAVSHAVATVCSRTSRKVIAELKSHEARIGAVAISPDGRFIVTGSDDRTAVLWDDRGKLLAIYKGHTDAVRHVAISPDGRSVATGSDDGTARIWPRDLWPAILDRRTRELTPQERQRYELPAE